MYLLDTCVVSELRKAADGKADPRVLAWQSGVDILACFLSVVTLHELQTGILRIARRDAGQGGRFRVWLEQQVIPQFAGRILPIDEAVALRCAALHAPAPRPAHDAMIAATALVHEMTVVTRNTADFEQMGAALIDPWQTPVR